MYEQHNEEEGRDDDLEAQDDTASFDIGNDIEAWWSANRQIEMAGKKIAKRRQLFRQFGIRNMHHHRYAQARGKRCVDPM